MADCGHTAVLHDPQPLWLEALQQVLTSLDITVVGKANTIEQALSMVEAHRPDIFLVDTGVTGSMTGPSLVRAAVEIVPSLRVIAISGSAEPGDIDAAFDAGAIAYVVKTAHAEDVAATVRQAFDHSIFLSRVGHGPNRPTSEAGHGAAKDTSATLTRREREILVLVAEGLSNRELAQMLWVTEQTIKFH